MDSDEEGGGSFKALTDMAKAFGFNLPEMNRDRESLVLRLQDAQTSADRAEFQLQLDQVQHNFEDLMQKVGGSQSPVESAIGKVTEQLILEKFGAGGGNSLETRMMDRLFTRMEKDMDAQDHPPGVVGQLAAAVNTLKELQDVMHVLQPAPAPPPASHMTPEAVLELEFEKLKMEKEIAFYRIDKEVDLQKSKSEAFTTVAKYVGDGLEFVGKVLGKEILASEGVEAPASFSTSTSASPAHHATDDVGSWVQCPSCEQDGLFVTTGMREQIGSGIQVDVTCTKCGEEHQAGGPASGSDSSKAPSQSPTNGSVVGPPPRYRSASDGKALPRFAVGA